MLNGDLICEQFIDDIYKAERVVSTPYGFAVLLEDKSQLAHIAFLDEKSGEITEMIELGGGATELFWLGGRLVVFYAYYLYLLTPEE